MKLTEIIDKDKLIKALFQLSFVLFNVSKNMYTEVRKVDIAWWKVYRKN